MTLFALETMKDSPFGGEQFISFPEEDYSFIADLKDNITHGKQLYEVYGTKIVGLYILLLASRQVKDDV